MSSVSTATLPLEIGPYRPVRKLGQGGMGVVYAAEDVRAPGRIVALKVVSWVGESKHDDPLRRFVREAKILEKLRHPNIVSFLEVGLHEGKTYFAMELLDGMPLTAYLGRPWVQLVPILIQVCYGMEYLSAQAIVHRDLSPDNILVAEKDGRPLAKILDFGIAKDTEQQETLYNFTKTGVLMGKPQYWSPELIGVLGPGETIDWRSDVYTLGIIFYRVLSGVLPFQADSPLSYIDLHMRHVPEEVAAPQGLPLVPPPISSLVQRMMAKSREDRPKSYAEIIGVLRDALDAAPRELKEASGNFVVLRPPAPTTDSGRPAPMPSRTPTSPTLTGPTISAPRSEETVRTGSVLGSERDDTVRTEGALPGAGTAPPTKVTVRSDLGRPRTGRSRALLSSITLALVAGVAAVLWFAVRPAFRAAPSRPPAASPLSVSPGRLALHSVPWARVTSITDEKDGRRVALAENATTPVVLDLPPARYTVEIVSSAGGETERVSVEIRPGETVSRSIVFVDSRAALGLLD